MAAKIIFACLPVDYYRDCRHSRYYLFLFFQYDYSCSFISPAFCDIQVVLAKYACYCSDKTKIIHRSCNRVIESLFI